MIGGAHGGARAGAGTACSVGGGLKQVSVQLAFVLCHCEALPSLALHFYSLWGIRNWLLGFSLGYVMLFWAWPLPCYPSSPFLAGRPSAKSYLPPTAAPPLYQLLPQEAS